MFEASLCGHLLEQQYTTLQMGKWKHKGSEQSAQGCTVAQSQEQGLNRIISVPDTCRAPSPGAPRGCPHHGGVPWPEGSSPSPIGAGVPVEPCKGCAGLGDCEPTDKWGLQHPPGQPAAAPSTRAAAPPPASSSGLLPQRRSPCR